MSLVASKPPVEFGDFQTPPELARKVIELARVRGFKPHGILEPTCGVANLLSAALEIFEVEHALGIEIQAAYIARARLKCADRAEIRHSDFFDLNVKDLLSRLPQPVFDCWKSTVGHERNHWCCWRYKPAEKAKLARLDGLRCHDWQKQF